MIIFGSKKTLLDGAAVQNACPHCQSKNTVQMLVYQKYAHVYWIPFFPIRKEAFTQCEHCKQVLEEKDFPYELQQISRVLRPNPKHLFGLGRALRWWLRSFFLLNAVAAKTKKSMKIMSKIQKLAIFIK